MSEKNYPEEIYETRDGLTMTLKQRDGYGGQARRRAYDLGYRDGRFKERLEASNPRAGWSNLTEAIKDKVRIDWERLDGIEAKCVHPELGTLTYKMERDNICSSTMPSGWYINKSANVWKQAVSDSWYGLQGWTLWVKGDLPLRKQTADQMAPGTCFRARYTKGEYVHTYSRAQVVQVNGELRVFCFNEHFSHVIATYTPAEVEVLEVYGPGTFQTPGEDA